jgi:hypothetical protein
MEDAAGGGEGAVREVNRVKWTVIRESWIVNREQGTEKK